MANDSDSVTWSDLQDKLLADASGTEKTKIIGVLEKHRTALKSKIDGGLPPDEYKSAQELENALKTAQGVVEDYWTTAHKKK